jgi:hypothetical protein
MSFSTNLQGARQPHLTAGFPLTIGDFPRRGERTDTRWTRPCGGKLTQSDSQFNAFDELETITGFVNGDKNTDNSIHPQGMMTSPLIHIIVTSYFHSLVRNQSVLYQGINPIIHLTQRWTFVFVNYLNTD